MGNGKDRITKPYVHEPLIIQIIIPYCYSIIKKASINNKQLLKDSY